MAEGQEKEPVSFKGTRMGVMVSITEEGSFADNLVLLRDRLEENHQLFRGAGMNLDLGWRELHPEDLSALQDFLITQGIKLQGIISTSLTTRKLAESIGIKVIIGRLGLSEHYSRTSKKEQEEGRKPSAAIPQEETLMLRKTIRSGQKIEYNGNVVVQGDVNAGPK